MRGLCTIAYGIVETRQLTTASAMRTSDERKRLTLASVVRLFILLKSYLLLIIYVRRGPLAMLSILG